MDGITLYVCDRKKCKYCGPDCRHTTVIEHAKYEEHTDFEQCGAFRVEKIKENDEGGEEK